MKSIDIKIANAQRRIEEERKAQTPNHAPTQGLTDMASTANNNVPMRKPAMGAGLDIPGTEGITKGAPLYGAVVAHIAEIGIGASAPGEMVRRTTFFPPIQVHDGDTIELGTFGGIKIIRTEPAECSPTFSVGFAPTLRPIEETCTVAEAMDRLKLAMKEDPDYARTWHDNIAMALLHGAIGIHTDRYVANAGAAIFMERCFDVDTSEHAKRVWLEDSTQVVVESPTSIIKSLSTEGNARHALFAAMVDACGGVHMDARK